MSISLVRALILYILVIFAVRLMGKRQLGELQPSELVITILVSNIATLPLEDTDIPMIVGITPILLLVCFEVAVSWLGLRFPKVRELTSGSPKIIISNGAIDRKVMRELRFSVDDVMAALRSKDVFDIADVQFAIVETNGSISVMKHPSADTPVRSELGISPEDSDPPQVIVSDGRVISAALRSLGLDPDFAKRTAKSKNLRLDEVFIMTADSSGKCSIFRKSGGRPLTVKGEEK